MRIRSVPTLVALAALALLPTAAARAQLAVDVHPLPQDPALRAELSLHDGTLQELVLPDAPGAPFLATVQLDAQAATLVMMPRDLRADDFKLLVQLADGSLVEQVPPAPATYQGWVDGMPESLVAGSLVDGELTATIVLAPGLPSWGVQPMRSVDPGAPRGLHVVYDGSDLDAIEGECGTDTTVARPTLTTPGAADGSDPSHKVCQIALDADFEYFTKNASSVAATQTDMESIINAVEGIYDATAGIHYEITTVIVRSAEPDPYSTTSASGLLNQFQSEWNANQAAAVRDVAHLFTGKNISGSTIGIAYLGVICNKSSAYGLSQSKYTGAFAYRTALTAHELGHNWNASHCDGQGDCKIMCSGLGGCTGGVTSFGASATTKITQKKNSSGCLSGVVPPPPPTISSLSSATAPALLPGPITVTGTNLAETTSVTVGGTVLTVGAGINTVSATQVGFTPPSPTTLGPVPVTVTTTGGTSNALNLSYTETDPPQISGAPFSITDTPFTWTYGGGAGDTAYLIVALNNATFTYQGSPVLLNNLTVTVQALNGAGLGSHQIVIPVAAAGLVFWSQVVTFDGPTVRASNILSTWIPY